MMRILNPQTNQYEEVEDQVGYHAILNGHQAEQLPKTFYLQNPDDNQIYEFNNLKDAQNAFKAGGVAATPHQFELQKSAASTVDTLTATGAAGIRGASFGLSDVAASALSPEIREKLAVLREAHPVASAIGEIGGIGASMLIPGSGVARLAGATERIGAKAGATIAGMGAGKVITRGIELAAQGASEGLVYGGASALSDLALDERPLTAEMMGSEIFKGAITGAAIGGVATPIFGAVGAGIGKTADVVEKQVKKLLPQAEDLRAQFLSRSTNAAKLSRQFSERYGQNIPPEEVHRVLAKGLGEIETPSGVKSIWLDDAGNVLTTPMEVNNRIDDLFGQVADKRKEVLEKMYNDAFNDDDFWKAYEGIKIFDKTESQLQKEIKGLFKVGEVTDSEVNNLLKVVNDNKKSFENAFATNLTASGDNYFYALKKTIHEYKEGLNARIENRGWVDLTPSDVTKLERKIASDMRKALESLPSGDKLKKLNQDFSKLYNGRDIVEKMLDNETAKAARLSPLDWLFRGNLRAFIPGVIGGFGGGFGVGAAVALGTKAASIAADRFKTSGGLLEMTKYLSTENVIKRRISKALDGRFVKATGNSVYNYSVGALANYLSSDNKNIKEFTRKFASIDTTPHAEELANLSSTPNVVRATKTANDIKDFILSKTPKISIDPSTGIEQKPARKEVLKYAEYVVAATNPIEMIRTLQQGRSLTDVQKEVLEFLYPGVNSFIESQVHGRNQLSNSPLKNSQRIKATLRNVNSGKKMLITQSTFQNITQPEGRRVSGVRSKASSYATQSDRIAQR